LIVVDTNILAALLLSTEASAEAEAALAIDSEWFSPPPWRSELRNVLAILIQQQRLDLSRAYGVMEQAETMLYQRELEASTLEVLRLSSESGCTAYDCEFVAVARQLGAPLVTLDRQILHEFPSTAVSLSTFVDD